MTQHSRRTVVRTAVWSVPAISVVAAAPAYANTSGGPSVTVAVISACKDPGKSQGSEKLYTYEVKLAFTNNDPVAHDISVTRADSYKNNGDPAGLNPFQPIPDDFTLAAKSMTSRVYTSVDNADSENTNVVFTYYVDGRGPFTVEVDNFHPCQSTKTP